jgi:O-antigen/teichoic acid export membrane protein
VNDAARRPTGSRHFLTATGSGYLARIVAILVGVAVLPIGIEAYGFGVFGVWIAASSLSQYATNGALGMPLAVLTAISATEKREAAARIGAQGVRVVVSGSLGLAVIGGTLWLAFPGWPESLFGALGATTDVVVAVAVLLIGTLLLQPLQIYATVLAGRHRIIARNAYEVGRTLGRLVSLVAASSVSDGLTELALITIGVDLLIALMRSAHVTFFERIPVHRYLIDRSSVRPGLVPSGLRFFILQVQVTAIRNTDNLVISGILGAAAVSIYAAPFRLVTAVTSLIEAIQEPLWPAYGAARQRDDWDWIRRAHQRVLVFGLALGGAAWIGTVGFAGPVIALWLGTDFPVDPWVVLVLGAYAFVATWVNANAILLNALDATQSQVLSGGAEAAVNLTSSIILAPILGLVGVAGGTFLGATSVSSWLLPLDVRRRTEGRLTPRFTDLLCASVYTVPLVSITHLVVVSTAGPARYGLPAVMVLLQLAASAFLFRDHLQDLLPPRGSS